MIVQTLNTTGSTFSPEHPGRTRPNTGGRTEVIDLINRPVVKLARGKHDGTEVVRITSSHICTCITTIHKGLVSAEVDIVFGRMVARSPLEQNRRCDRCLTMSRIGIMRPPLHKRREPAAWDDRKILTVFRYPRLVGALPAYHAVVTSTAFFPACTDIVLLAANQRNQSGHILVAIPD